MAHDEKVIELARQIFVIVVGDAPHREHVRIVRGANGGDGAGFHIHRQRRSGLAESHLVFRAQHHFIGREDSSTVDAKLAGQFVVPRQTVRATPANILAIVSVKIEHLGADDDVAGAYVVLQPAAKAGTDDEVRPVTLDGHLGGDPGAFLADAESEECDRLAVKRAFVEIEVFLPDHVRRVGATQDGAQLLFDGDENRDQAQELPGFSAATAAATSR